MFGGGKLGKMKRMMKNPAQAPPVQRIAGILTEVERAQTDAVRDLADALDAEEVRVEPVDVEARREEILALVETMAPGGDGSPAEWWVDYRLADLDGGQDLVEYVQMDPADWHEQMEDRDREQTAETLRDRFGVDGIEEFEERVIDVTGGDIPREGLVGRLTSVEDSVTTAADRVREGEE